MTAPRFEMHARDATTALHYFRRRTLQMLHDEHDFTWTGHLRRHAAARLSGRRDVTTPGDLNKQSVASLRSRWRGTGGVKPVVKMSGMRIQVGHGRSLSLALPFLDGETTTARSQGPCEVTHG